MSRQGPSGEAGTKEKSGSKTALPPQFKVLMHNDDYTTMDFVVQMLEGIFRKSSTEAHQIMLNIHFNGIGICGTYPCEIAETKVERVHSSAREAGFPLKCSLEEA